MRSDWGRRVVCKSLICDILLVHVSLRVRRNQKWPMESGSRRADIYATIRNNAFLDWSWWENTRHARRLSLFVRIFGGCSKITLIHSCVGYFSLARLFQLSNQLCYRHLQRERRQASFRHQMEHSLAWTHEPRRILRRMNRWFSIILRTPIKVLICNDVTILSPSLQM